MHCTRQINPDVTWVGANDRRLAMFEGVYEVPRGVSYNSYLICDDDKTVLLDTVDKAVWRTFMENLNYALQGRPLDYLIVQHMEPDHSAFILQLQILHPNLTIVCNERTLGYMKQFFPTLDSSRVLLVKEGDTLTTGRHTLHFILAPMVHWPEVMLTYDATDKTLYSADAFGCFGALNGALYADEVDFEREYMDEMRRYYTNIVGKYGQQVQSVLAKASGLDIRLICPLHGFLWRANFVELLHKYHLWSSYEPEEQGVLIAYASVYGNTENAVEILATCLREQGITTVMYDVSVTPASEIVAQAFRFSHLVFAATTYNAGIFIAMEDFLNDLTAHNIQNRVVALIENGTWAPTSGGLMQQKLAKCKNITFLQDPITIVSSVKEEQRVKLVELAKTIAGEIVVHPAISPEQEDSSIIDPTIFMSIPYGLYLLTTKGENKANGCIINTLSQITANPLQVAVTVSKSNYTNDLILQSGIFNVSLLMDETPFELFRHFGYSSGRDQDKFPNPYSSELAPNGVPYLTQHSHGVISGKVKQSIDCGSHMIHLAEVTHAVALNNAKTVTYDYYQEHIKPRPQLPKEQKGYLCQICAYHYEGETLPEDFICPLCKHGPEAFKKIG